MNEPIAKKTLGQHWLHDKSVLESMCDAADITEGDEILEIGPGTGSLTSELMNRQANIFALEMDVDAIGYLRKVYARQWDVCLHVEQGDIRTFNLNTLPKNYKIVANIPYYLTSHLIQILSESNNPPSVAVLLVQKEVAQRVCAKPGSMSILSITSQYYWETSLGVEVPAALFTPPPKVDSQVIVLKRRPTPLFDADSKQFFKIVKSGFSNKRKTLLNSLSGSLGVGKPVVNELLESADMKSGCRPQELSMDEWFTLYKTAKLSGLL